MKSRFLDHTKKTFLVGLVLTIPVVVTYAVLKVAFDFVDGILQPGVELILGQEIPGVGLVVLVIGMYLLGLVAANVLGRKLVTIAQNLIQRVPLVRAVYLAAKEFTESFSGQRPTGFNRVVAVEYPKVDSWMIGFLTATTKDEDGRVMGVVYIPTAPTPQSGWVVIIPIDEVYDVELPVPSAMRMVLSGGVITPPELRKSQTAPY